MRAESAMVSWSYATYSPAWKKHTSMHVFNNGMEATLVNMRLSISLTWLNLKTFLIGDMRDACVILKNDSLIILSQNAYKN